MIRNYILVAWRNLLKHRIISIINLIGLSISISFCLLLIFHIRKEISYDGFHKNKDRIFRMEMTNLFPDPNSKKTSSIFSFLTRQEDVDNQAVFPMIVGRDIKAAFPEVNHYVRFQDIGSQLVKLKQKTFKQDHVIYADPDFFGIFSFPLIKGRIFSSPHSVVLSNTTAKKLFGNEDPLGKTITITIDTALDFVVTGIAADAPDNSGIQIGMVIPPTADPYYQERIDSRFNSSSNYLMLELKNGVSFTAFEQKLNQWMKTYFADYIKDFQGADMAHFHWYLRPLTDCHFTLAGYWGHYTDKKNLYQLACLVIVILLIAALNYVLLTVSRATARSLEVGIRKVLGANKRAVIFQFWVETQVLVLIAVGLGLMLSMLLLPVFNHLLGINILYQDFSPAEIAISAIIISLVLGLFAGYYPALILSRMPAVSVLKSFRTFKINPKFSTVMVVVQYTACVILMASAFVINRQMHFLNNRDLGFDKDQVLMVKNPTFDFDFTKNVKDRLYAFSKTQPYVIQYSGMNGGLNGAYNTNGFKLNGQQQWRKQLTVDYGFFEMLGLRVIQGRSFSRSFPTDTIRKSQPTVVNETLFRLLGKTAKLGEYNEPLGETIIGIVKDYNFETLNKKIEPEGHVLATNFVTSFMFKVRAGHMQEAIEKIGGEWKNITGDFPFEYTFLDQTIAKMYEENMRWQNIIQSTCFFAIFIACLGLFGLSSINALNRFKEIGIRKVLGASVTDIIGTLSIKFMLWVAMAIIIAIPISWFIMNNWLQDFAYRVDIHWWLFAFVGLVAMAIAFCTISIQAFIAGMVNPVKSLRSE